MKTYIIEDPKDAGQWPLYRGIIGPISSDNVYLRAYAQWPDTRRPCDLGLGSAIEGVVFRLSGERGVYNVRRVK